ncbi:protein kinase [Duganella sp. CY15W]|uniref:protein kinase domain-containing protein n=1 Tax=Duganella sp. CY15W TaxID=2692172 RepID=UPI00136EE35A|nr:protein kinase [Duganella sp. CY15W]MYM30674.1 protein kinase [Duganella sp. CY15W]
MALKNPGKPILQAMIPNTFLGKQVGAGGNGCVYFAVHPSLGDIAVKFMLNDDVRRYSRFKDEVKVVTKTLLEFDCVLPILESNLPDTNAGTYPWYIMPRAQGLAESLKSKSPLERLSALVDLSDALVKLHSVNVAHRDIKPENLFCFDGRFVFGDFGLASFPEKSGVTKQGEPMGPFAYISPEMLSQPNDADPFKSDVYSFAKTVWTVLTGEKYPFSGQYDRNGEEGLTHVLSVGGFVFEPLEKLLRASTSSTVASRPNAQEFAQRMHEVLRVQEEILEYNPLQWEAAEVDALLSHGAEQVIWRNASEIAKVLVILSRRNGLNHFFLPGGGGLTLTHASICEGGAMLDLDCDGSHFVVNPLRLTLERFPDYPKYGYAVLEVGEAAPLGADLRYRSDRFEYLRKVGDFDYVVNDSDNPESEMRGERCERFFGAGKFIIAPTAGIYNQVDGYDGSLLALDREHLRAQFDSLFAKLTGEKNVPILVLRPFPRLLMSDQGARVPFKLEHISDETLHSLLLADKALAERHRASNGVGGRVLSAAELMDRIRAPRSAEEIEARRLVQSLSPEEGAEYLALANIGRGYASVEDFASEVESNLLSQHQSEYLAEKIGHGYLGKALLQFGVVAIFDSSPEVLEGDADELDW